MMRPRYLLWIFGVAIVAGAAGTVWLSSTKSPPTAVENPVVGGETIEALLESARVYANNQEFGKAEAVLRAGVGRLPGEASLREALGEVLLQQDKREEALAQYDRLIEDGSDSAEVAFTAGSLAAVLGDPGRAAGYHERAQKLDPSNADYPVHLAQAQIALGRIDEAKASLTRSAVLDEGRGLVWGMLAELALRENKLELAGQHVGRARRLEPEVVAWLVIEARLLKRRGEAERALLLLSGLGAADRWEGPVVKTMAECLGMLNRGDDALALYEIAIEKRPGDAGMRFEAALWAERLDDRERALALAKQALMMGEKRAAAVVDRLE